MLWRKSWDVNQWTRREYQAASELIEGYEIAREAGGRRGSAGGADEITRLKGLLIDYENLERERQQTAQAQVDARSAISDLEQLFRKPPTSVD